MSSQSLLELKRNQMIAYLNRMGYKKAIKSGQKLEDIITCDKCTDKNTCPSVYDIYNTDGDCLEGK